MKDNWHESFANPFPGFTGADFGFGRYEGAAQRPKAVRSRRSGSV
jgi:hypothetical protein